MPFLTAGFGIRCRRDSSRSGTSVAVRDQSELRSSHVRAECLHRATFPSGRDDMKPSVPDKEETPVFASVDDAKPVEEGGPTARIGFNYQDQIACSLLIEMLAMPDIAKVHCESHDDAVVIRQENSTPSRTAEFVQVKSNDKTWTVSDLCASKGNKGKSLYETSLAKDQYKEVSRFRVVTLRPVSKDLRLLTFPIGAPGRQPTGDPFKSLQAYIDGKFPKLQSKKGNGSSYWIRNCAWDVRDSEQAIFKANVFNLMTLGLNEGRPLFVDQAQTLLDELLDWAKVAGAARWDSRASRPHAPTGIESGEYAFA